MEGSEFADKQEKGALQKKVLIYSDLLEKEKGEHLLRPERTMVS